MYEILVEQLRKPYSAINNQLSNLQFDKNGDSVLNAIKIIIGDHVIEIKSNWPYYELNTLYTDFITDKPYDYQIEIDDDDIESYVEVLQRLSIVNSVYYVKIRPSCVLKKVAEALLDANYLLMHGASVVYNNEAFLFTAVSGTGKTTHAKKWVEFAQGGYILNGDKLFINCSDGTKPIACCSPWAGKENFYTNISAPLKAIVILERAEDNCIEQIPYKDAFPKLLQQVYKPEDERKMRHTLRLMTRLANSVSFWRFQCNNFKDDCFEVAFNALTAHNYSNHD